MLQEEGLGPLHCERGLVLIAPRVFGHAQQCRYALGDSLVYHVISLHVFRTVPTKFDACGGIGSGAGVTTDAGVSFADRAPVGETWCRQKTCAVRNRRKTFS